MKEGEGVETDTEDGVEYDGEEEAKVEIEEDSYEDYGKEEKDEPLKRKPTTRETDLTANDIKAWSLEESTINKFKNRYENEWRIEIDKAVAEMLEQVKVDN